MLAMRPRPRILRLLPALALAVAGYLLPGGASATSAGAEDNAPREPLEGKSFEDFAFRIEDTKSYIGIAAVKLSVGKLEPKNGKLVGSYRIRVPLMGSKNDHGRIVLPFDVSVQDLGEKGGTLRGKAYSEKNEKEAPHTIVCEIHPLDRKTLRLAITTPHRTIEFDSTYSLIRRNGRDG